MRWRRMSSRTRIWAWAIVAWTAAWSVLIGSTCAPGVKYVYDENGRLIAVVDDVTQSSGNAAVYHYDAAGNITSIERVSGNTPTILNFTPKCGPAGTTVIVNGLGLVSSTGPTAVQFGSSAALTPTSADDTRVTVQTVNGTTSGVVSVHVGSPETVVNTSPQQFTVGCVGPTITSVNPSSGTPGDRGVLGDPVQITGTNFRTAAAENRVRFNGRESVIVGMPSSTIINTRVPSGAMSGKITVTTPDGTGTSPSDFTTRPPAPPGVPEYPLSRVELGSPLRINPTGSSTVNIVTGNDLGMVLFEGVAGGRVSLSADTMTFGGGNVWPDVRIFAPNGVLVYQTITGGWTLPPSYNTGWIDAFTLPQDGTYTIAVFPLPGALTGSIHLTVYDATDVTTPITSDGTPTHVTISNPGQNARFAFTPAIANFRVAVQITSPVDANLNDSAGNRALKLLSQIGSVVATPPGSVTRAIDATNLPTSEQYTVLVDLRDKYVGDVTARLFNPADQDFNIVRNGSARTVTLSVIGSNAYFHFHWDGTGACVWPSANSFCDSSTHIWLRADVSGNNLGEISHCPPSPGYAPVGNLPTGDYTIVVDPPVDPSVTTGPPIGSVTIRVSDCP